MSERRASYEIEREDKSMTGIELIVKERERQISTEGWTLNHDDQHKAGELARAATAYIMADERDVEAMKYNYPHTALFPTPGMYWWPPLWSLDWWKPTTRLRNLVKAGALIAAEIDRLLRMEEEKK